eukprot:CAMPEP_0114122932 /NCGR_PEP_ID=MMETSP0043_2-20121206/7957_1 /TAXON_ID=464988 /ORGANISM="Hemiselmis andersenii, Strain CCMP644" /LENGTH=48 /DNA_ID= /DNA_START= /DNA_END= /DNA_ORIENTATION=
MPLSYPLPIFLPGLSVLPSTAFSTLPDTSASPTPSSDRAFALLASSPI